ncbi:MAG: Smr/MutS family protein [Marinilabiliaceae bacterium]|nr:Smr/MutS family protein [Marinilabiliaceae bacterium]
MIYPNNFEEKIKFNKIRNLIIQQCTSLLGIEWVDKMSFSTHYNQVSTWLHQTNEFVRVLTEEEQFPGLNIIDVREPLKKIRIEGLFLEEKELDELRKSLISTRDLLNFFNSKSDEEYPYLKKLTKQININPSLINKIDCVLDKFGKIKDNATPELASIRREIQSLQISINRKMVQILKQAKSDGLIEGDVSVSIRDGRAVIPVPSPNKRKLGGIIHDESSTGKTTFIEPTAIVEINNQLRELEYAQRREIIKILTDISNYIRPYLADLFNSFNFMGQIDFIRAKAKLALNINGILPNFNNTPELIWDKAVHPLLYIQHKTSGLSVVPLDIQLNNENRILVISGPNAGGKSVCLQTVGLLQYMFQCGLLIPLNESSKVGFFDQILLDMGDEQSIENDLSTYSSHLLNMKNFIKLSNNKTLILIDEFGTGTEPMLGGAIAESVLQQLNNQCVFGIVTTHYTNLKHVAAQTNGLMNGAMLFDTHAIQPLFRLEIGKPGSSFAFEIARKIGLPESILDQAKEKIGQEHIDYDKHLREIARDKRYWEQKRQNIRNNEKKLEDVLAQYKEELDKVNKEKKEIIKNAKIEANELLRNANQKIENTIREIKESQAEKEKTRVLRQELIEFKEEINIDNTNNNTFIDKKIQQIRERENRKKIRPTKKTNEPNPIIKEKKEFLNPLQIGDQVALEGQNIPGEIIEIKDKNAVVAFGQIQSIVKLNRLKRVSGNQLKKENRSIISSSPGLIDKIMNKKLNFKPDIDVRGKRGKEALQIVINHIDEALICETNSFKILHGKGDGILRQMIRDYLDTVDFVKSFRDEHVQFGGSGITIVELDI